MLNKGKNALVVKELSLKTEFKMEGTNLLHSDTFEEPVSPPACDPTEGPPLILNIEELASGVVEEQRNASTDTTGTSKKHIILPPKKMKKRELLPRTVEPTEGSFFTNLIPATVSDLIERPYHHHMESSTEKRNPTLLHMSGGGVMTGTSSPVLTTPSIENTNLLKNKPEKQYFTLQYMLDDPVQNSALNTEGSRTLIDQNESIEIQGLPLDLSITKIPKDNGLHPNKKKNNKRPREELAPELEISVKKKPYVILPLPLEDKEVNHEKALISKEKQVSVSKKVKETSNKTQKDDGIKKQNVSLQDVSCKLVLPKQKGKKAKIIFENGMFVEIDRHHFTNFEQNLQNTGRTVQKPRTSRSKKNTTKRQRKQEEANLPAESCSFDQMSNATSTNGQDSEDYPRNMPLLIFDDDQEEEKINKKINEVQIDRDINMTPPPTPPQSPPNTSPKHIQMDTSIVSQRSTSPISPSPNPTFESSRISTPPPSNPGSPPGLHKLPKMISKPCYYRLESKTKAKLK